MLKKFLSYVEIKTKITSIFAFLLALSYLFYRGQQPDWHATAVFFLSMFIFDLATTAINNYIDTRTNHQKLQFARKNAFLIIMGLLAISTFLGIYLVYLTDVVVLLIGGVCFLAGIFYTFGPLPISRLPLGEVVSGFFYGFLIPFLMLYINMPEGTYLSLGLDFSTMALFVQLNLVPIVTVIFLSAAPVLTTANIMLANNICDLEKDIAVKRHTLPYYIGYRALDLFALLYYIIYAANAVMVILGILSPLVLLLFLTLPVVHRNIKRFKNFQEKSSTFLLSIQNYIIIMGAQALLIFLSGLF